MSLPAAFTVTATGTAEGCEPYTMRVQLTEHYLIIDQIKLSWNDARVAFEIQADYGKRRKALFPHD